MRRLQQQVHQGVVSEGGGARGKGQRVGSGVGPAGVLQKQCEEVVAADAPGGGEGVGPAGVSTRCRGATRVSGDGV